MRKLEIRIYLKGLSNTEPAWECSGANTSDYYRQIALESFFIFIPSFKVLIDFESRVLFPSYIIIITPWYLAPNSFSELMSERRHRSKIGAKVCVLLIVHFRASSDQLTRFGFQWNLCYFIKYITGTLSPLVDLELGGNFDKRMERLPTTFYFWIIWNQGNDWLKNFKNFTNFRTFFPVDLKEFLILFKIRPAVDWSIV